MKVLHALIAYMPFRHGGAESMTRTAIAGAEDLGYPLVVWHAGDKPTPGPLCPVIHDAMVPAGFKGEIVEYENGNLSDNWLQAWDDGFEWGADWVLWTSNDVVWNDKARKAIDALLEKADDMTVYTAAPFIYGLIPRRLFEKVRPHWDVNWEPSMHDDSNFLGTVLWQGGHVELNCLRDQLTHFGRITETTYCSNGKMKEDKNVAIGKNFKKFVERWGISPHNWPVPGNVEWREPRDTLSGPSYPPRRYSHVP